MSYHHSFRKKHKQFLSVQKSSMTNNSEVCNSIHCQCLRYVFNKKYCWCCCPRTKTPDYEEKTIRMKKRIDAMKEEIQVLRNIILEQSKFIQNCEMTRPT